MTEPSFIVDINVAKLARWLRMMGYDAVLFGHGSDSRLIRTALTEERIVLTRDTHIMERRVITSGRLRALLICDERPERQIRQVIEQFDLDGDAHPFSRCLECNSPLVPVARGDVAERVPPHVFQTQPEFMECPACHRVYWKGTHWQAMLRRLEGLTKRSPEEG